MNKIHAIYDGDDFVEGYWWDLAHAADRAVELGRGAVRSFEMKDAPDTTWPFADAIAFVSDTMARSYLEELVTKIRRISEGARLAGMGERHLRRLLAHHGLKTRFDERRHLHKLAAEAAIAEAVLDATLLTETATAEVPA